MEYINDLIRRKDRLLSEDEAMSLLENGDLKKVFMAFPLIMYGINNSLSIFIVLPKGVSFVYFKTVIRHRFAW